MPTSAIAAAPTLGRAWARCGIAREPRAVYGVGPAVADPIGARLDDVLDELCAEGRIGALTDAEVEQQVDVARRLEGAAAVLTARALRELERRGATRGSSATEWLKATGRSGKEAARAGRLAASLDRMPATAEALATGDIGPESADALVQAAREGVLGMPGEVEDGLLTVAASGSPEDLRAEIRRREQAVEADALLRDERRQHRRRRVTLSRRDDGMWDLAGRLTGESGTRLRTWLDAFDRPDPDGTPLSERRRPDQRLADALDTAVDAALDAGTAPQTGGVARPHLAVLVDLATFDADLSDPQDPSRPAAPEHPVWRGLTGGRTEWGVTLSPQATRRLCCDAGVSRVVMAGASQVLDVGRATREWSAAQRRAVRARDRHCRGPNCRRPIGWTEVHHLQWWRHDGPTAVDNGVSLCRGCHRLVHDAGWHAELDLLTAAVTWTSPDRRRTVVSHPRPTA